MKKIPLIATLVLLLFAEKALALGIRAPSCENGRLWRRVGVIVCLENKTNKGISEIPRRANRPAHYRREKVVRKSVRRPVHRVQRKAVPFYRSVSVRRNARLVRREAQHILDSRDNTAEIERIREVQRKYHESRR